MAEYVGSGEYGKRGKEYNPNVGRYDYFEAPVTINGKGYIVSFDVASCADVNNYRTHRLADITITPQKPSDRLVQTGLSSAGSADTLVSDTNITQGETAVNSESQGVESIEQLAAEYTERYNRAREIEQSGGDISQEEKTWLSGTLQRLLDMQQGRVSDRLALIGEERARNGETSKGRNTEANHIDNRTEKDMASQQTKAFSFDHPELHPYFVEAAKVLREDVGEALSSDYTKKNAEWRILPARREADARGRA